MHIAIDIRCLTEKNRTGVGEYTFQLLDALFKIDQENQYILFYNSFKDISNIVPKWKQENVRCVATRWPNKIFHLFVFLGLIKLDRWILRNSKSINPPLRGVGGCTTVVDSPLDETPPSPPQGGNSTGNNIDFFFSPNINFTQVSKQTKFILTIHDLSFELFKDCYSWKRRLWHRIVNPKKQCDRADIILTPSVSTKLDVEREYGVACGKVRCIYPGLEAGSRKPESEELKIFKNKHNLPEKYILYLGTLEPRKNISAIIEAYYLSNLLATGYELVIAGATGWKYEKILKKINETSGVRYLGYVDEVGKQMLYQNASLFVFPSLYEGFGFPVLEALSCGTPVITSNRSSLPEVVGLSACVVNPYNISEIAEFMRTILKHDPNRDILAKREIDFSNNFSWEKSAQDFLNYIS